MRTIDISMTLNEGMPVWPGSPGVKAERFLNLDQGDQVNATLLALDVHCGTHVDAPLHFLAAGADSNQILPERLIGEAFVLDTGEATAVSAEVLAQAGIPAGTTRLLLKTSNSSRSELLDGPFRSDYCALDPSAADWLVANGIDLVGIDYLSIQLFDDPPDVHTTLLGAGVVILEGLRLQHAPEGACELICLSLLVDGSEAAPARAVIRTPR
jgi:arylformamidase